MPAKSTISPGSSPSLPTRMCTTSSAGSVLSLDRHQGERRMKRMLVTVALVFGVVALPSSASATHGLLEFESAVDAMLAVDPTLDPPPDDGDRDFVIGGLEAFGVFDGGFAFKLVLPVARFLATSQSRYRACTCCILPTPSSPSCSTTVHNAAPSSNDGAVHQWARASLRLSSLPTQGCLVLGCYARRTTPRLSTPRQTFDSSLRSVRRCVPQTSVAMWSDCGARVDNLRGRAIWASSAYVTRRPASATKNRVHARDKKGSAEALPFVRRDRFELLDDVEVAVRRRDCRVVDPYLVASELERRS